MTISFDFHCTGALFDGEAAKAAADYTDHIRHTMADDLVALVRARLDSVLKVNRGVYVSFAHQEVEGDMIVVTDRWINYGPWLEGVGSRVGPPGSGKWPMTRFEGYHTYRLTAEAYNAIAVERCESELPPYLALMNQ